MSLRKLLGEILIDMGFVTRQTLEEALRRQDTIFQEQQIPERLHRDKLVSEARLIGKRAPFLGEMFIDLGVLSKEQLGKALDRQKKSREVYQKLDKEKLSRVIETGLILNSRLGLSELLKTIMQQVNSVAESHASTLMLLDERTGELVFSVPTGLTDDGLTDIHIPRGKGIAGWVAENGDTLLVPDTAKDPRFYREIDKMTGIETKSILCVPLKSNAKVIGVLEAINKAGGTVFTEEDAFLLEIFANQAAMAIEHARLYRELREGQEDFLRLFDQSNDAIFVHRRGKIIDVNQKACEMLGYSRDQLLRMKINDLDACENSNRMKSRFKKVIGGNPVIFETRFVNADGHILDVEISSKAIDSEKMIIQGIVRDITERKKAQKALELGARTLRSILDAFPSAAFLIDTRGNIVEANKIFADKYGKKVDEIRGCNISSLTSNVFFENAKAKALQALSTKQPQYFEEKIEGTHFHNIISPTIDSEGNVDRLAIFSTDITEQRKMEVRLRQSQKMEAIGTLAGGIAHDFNNILGIIMGNTELAMDDVPEWNPARECLEEVRTASLRAKDVVRHILSFARKSTAEKNPVHTLPIIEDTLKLLRASLPSDVEILQDLSCPYDTVLAEPSQISQVLMNLCNNAAHAMAEEGGVMEVTLGNVELGKRNATLDLNAGRYVILTVTDTGYGIAPDIIDRVFDPYFTTKGLAGGTGLGLSVVHGIVKGLDGAVSVKSEAGKGSVFEVHIPCTEAEPLEVMEKEGGLPTGDECILYVDDEEGLVMAYAGVLKGLGYDVVTFTDPLKALEAFQREPERFDLVITDMTMPHMRGDRLAKEMMGIRPDVPVILCTGYSQRVSGDDAKAMGIKAFAVKPFGKKDLANTVRDALEKAPLKNK